MKQEKPPENLEEDKQPSLLKRISLIIIGIFLLFLMLSYFLAGPYTFDIIESMIVSSSMGEDMMIQGEGYYIVFETGSYDELKQIYLDTQDKEFKACLGGSIVDFNGVEHYVVDSVYFPEQRGSYAEVVYTQCPADTIISMHSHPYRHCRASEQDFESFEEFRKTAPGAVMMIMCEEDRFFVYR